MSHIMKLQLFPKMTERNMWFQSVAGQLVSYRQLFASCKEGHRVLQGYKEAIIAGPLEGIRQRVSDFLHFFGLLLESLCHI